MNSLKQEMLKRAVIYVRVSTKEQVDEGNSLATQERICKDYAQKNCFEVAEVFVEQGESAKTADRTELQKLLKFCADRKNGIKAVIIYKLDRLSRNTDDYSQLRLLLKRYGVEIKSTSEYFENTPVGRFMENTMANIAQFDNDIRAERSTNGMRDAVRDGRYVWMAPIGYQNIKVAGKSTIAQDPKIAPLVKKAFELVAGNPYSTEDVRKMITEEGLHNKQGKPFTKGYFYYLLRNELYCGRMRKFGEEHKGQYSPIVSEEVFDQVQMVLKYKGHKHSPHITDHPDFPLRRFVVNEYGKGLTGSWSKGRNKKYPYYRFGGKDTNYNRDVFEAAFIKFLDSFRIDKSKVQKLCSLAKKYLDERFVKEANEVEYLKKHIEDLKVRQSGIIRKNLDGIISDTVLKQQLEYIDKDLFEANARLLETGANQVDLQYFTEQIADYLENPSKAWRDAPIDTKVRLQWFQFPKGITFQNNTFGTTETSFLFKLKDSFTDLESYIVPSGYHFWNQYAKDCESLYKILKGSEFKDLVRNRSPALLN